jgi:branched-chain amino acid transport system ATP-binding protein
MLILEGQKVSKNFGGLAALQMVDFHISQGEVLGLIGPNGAGKTTLFNVISGAVPPTGGRIRFRGEDITRLSPHQICRRRVARTFQAVKIFSNMTVFENVMTGALFGASKGETKSATESEVTELLAFVGLTDKKDIFAKDLTIANQKRVEVARALATKPELLLLDEVVAGLTPAEVAQFVELIKKIVNRGITVFMIEHVMKAIMAISNRIIVLHHGEKIAEGTPEEITASNKVIEVYLGKPPNA